MTSLYNYKLPQGGYVQGFADAGVVKQNAINKIYLCLLDKANKEQMNQNGNMAMHQDKQAVNVSDLYSNLELMQPSLRIIKHSHFASIYTLSPMMGIQNQNRYFDFCFASYLEMLSIDNILNSTVAELIHGYVETCGASENVFNLFFYKLKNITGNSSWCQFGNVWTRNPVNTENICWGSVPGNERDINSFINSIFNFDLSYKRFLPLLLNKSEDTYSLKFTENTRNYMEDRPDMLYYFIISFLTKQKIGIDSLNAYNNLTIMQYIDLYKDIKSSTNNIFDVYSILSNRTHDTGLNASHFKLLKGMPMYLYLVQQLHNLIKDIPFFSINIDDMI